MILSWVLDFGKWVKVAELLLLYFIFKREIQRIYWPLKVMWRTGPLGLRNSGHSLSAEVLLTSSPDQSSGVHALPVLSDSLCATGVRESLNENQHTFVCSASTKKTLYSQAHLFSTMQDETVALVTMNLVYDFLFAFPVD